MLFVLKKPASALSVQSLFTLPPLSRSLPRSTLTDFRVRFWRGKKESLLLVCLKNPAMGYCYGILHGSTSLCFQLVIVTLFLTTLLTYCATWSHICWERYIILFQLIISYLRYVLDPKQSQTFLVNRWGRSEPAYHPVKNLAVCVYWQSVVDEVCSEASVYWPSWPFEPLQGVCHIGVNNAVSADVSTIKCLSELSSELHRDVLTITSTFRCYGSTIKPNVKHFTR